MSKYTTELRWICEDAYGLSGNEERRPSINQITSSPKVLNKVFDFYFPIFDEAYRPVLEQKILKRYYTREIGEETVELWKLRLDTRLNEIMPYYNKLYASELIEFNPLYNTNYTRQGNRDGKVLTDNSEDKTYNEVTDTDNTEVRTPELTDTKTLDLNDLKTLDLNDLKTLDLNDLKTLDLNDFKNIDTDDLKTLNLRDVKTLDLHDHNETESEDVKTLDLNDLKTVNLTDEKTLDLNDLKTLNLKDKKTLDLEDTKTLNLNELKTNNLTTDFDGQEDTAYSREDTKRSGVWDLYSDTPQGGIEGIGYAQSDPSLATNGYLTNARHTFGDGSKDNRVSTTGVTTDNQTRETGTVNVANTGTEILDRTGTDTLDKTGTENLDRTGTDTLERTGTESVDRTGTETVEGHIEENNAKTGTETVVRTGTEAVDLTTNETLERTGTESVDRTGTETVDRTGTENVDRTGTETLDRTGKETVKFDGEIGKNGNTRSIFDGEQNSTENYLEKVVGWNGSNPNKYLEDYRNNFLNIDLDIINKLRDLFMNIW